jgi:hypothetical protein
MFSHTLQIFSCVRAHTIKKIPTFVSTGIQSDKGCVVMGMLAKSTTKHEYK